MTAAGLGNYFQKNRLTLALKFFMAMQIVYVVGIFRAAMEHQLSHKGVVFFFSREAIASCLFGLFLFLGRKQKSVGRDQLLILVMPMLMMLVIYFAALHS